MVDLKQDIKQSFLILAGALMVYFLEGIASFISKYPEGNANAKPLLVS